MCWAIFFFVIRQEAVFSPFFLYLVFHSIIFVFRPLILQDDGSMIVWRYMSFIPTEEEISATYYVSALGLLAYVLGIFIARVYNMGAPETQHPSIIYIPISSRATAITWGSLGLVAIYSALFVGSSVAGSTAGIEMDRVGGVTINVDQNGYLLDAQFMLVGLCVLLVAVSNMKPASFLPLIIFFAYRTFVGWGRWTIVLTCMAVYSYYLVRNQRNWPRFSATIVGAGLFTLFTVLGQDREYFRNFFQGGAPTSDYSVGGPLQTIRDALSGLDFANFEYLAYILRAVPELTGTYTFGTQHLQLLTEPIPRALWPSKPAGAPIRLFDLNDYGNFLGLTTSLIGDGWASFGWTGVIVTMVLAGYTLERCYIFFRRSAGSVFVQLIYVSSAALLVQFFRDGSLTAIAKFMAFCLMPIFFAWWLSISEWKKSYSNSHKSLKT
jgi:hypothetical protein